MPAQTTLTDPIIVRLRALAEDSPELKQAASVYEMILLAVEDLATLHLDFIAQARGYARVEIR